MTRLSVIAACALTVVALVTVRLFVLPPTDKVTRVDAVVVLSGDYGDRIAGARALMARGAAPILVHAGQPDGRLVKDLCARGEIVCLESHPDSTRAEARAVAELARQRGWDSIALVTSKPHVTRAGMLFRRCFPGTVRVVGTDPPYAWRVWQSGIVHEWAGTLVYGLVRRGC